MKNNNSLIEHPFPIARFLNFGTTDILDWTILCYGSWSVHHKMFGSIPDHYLLDVSSNALPPKPPNCFIQKFHQALPNVLQVAKSPH